MNHTHGKTLTKCFCQRRIAFPLSLCVCVVVCVFTKITGEAGRAYIPF